MVAHRDGRDVHDMLRAVHNLVLLHVLRDASPERTHGVSPPLPTPQHTPTTAVLQPPDMLPRASTHRALQHALTAVPAPRLT